MNKIYEEKEGIDMKNSSESVLNILIESLVEEYKDVKELKIQENLEGQSSRKSAIKILSIIQENFINSKNKLIDCIHKFMGTNGWQDLSYFYSGAYDAPILTVNDEYYEECLLDWVVDLEKHLLHLYLLVICYSKENINALMQCYIETTILCKKLQYVIEQSISDFDSMTPEEKPLYNISFQELNFVNTAYNIINSNINELIIELFNYSNAYEQINKDLH